MKCATAACVLFFLVIFVYGKEDVVYELKGGDLFDLIRGIPPKNGTLKVAKPVAGDDGRLPDGIYYIPEDVLEEEPTEVQVKKKTPQGH